ncbi:hypothetical protein HO173_012397 [Letharia columbiana]|uniref:Uncharacterized protein n=1 Tax=Letharia columbiana TaxID=112416 RepID=A0A8H6CP42_9LECA|nr:uncharacterized protein HO173_012397 [Letharia columbiana]KAF6226651.1 hypothetical protein HO173_012397 [Letharia columbiana]
MDEWDRRERAQREQDRVRKLERKAKDAGNADFANTNNDNQREIIMKPEKPRQTATAKAGVTQKSRKWPKREKQQVSGAQLAPEAEQGRKGERKGQSQDSSSVGISQ